MVSVRAAGRRHPRTASAPGRTGSPSRPSTAPRSVVVSGEADALDELHRRASSGDGVRARRVNVDYASHSAQVEAIRDTVLAALDGIDAAGARDIPFYSSLTGDWLDTTELDADYWYAQPARTVRFEEAVAA